MQVSSAESRFDTVTGRTQPERPNSQDLPVARNTFLISATGLSACVAGILIYSGANPMTVLMLALLVPIGILCQRRMPLSMSRVAASAVPYLTLWVVFGRLRSLAD